MARKKAVVELVAKWDARMSKLVGHIFQVPVQEPYHTYAHFLADGSFAFYDNLTSEDTPDFAMLTAQRVLFRIHIMGLVFTQRARKWKDVGAWPIPEQLQQSGVFCSRSIKGRDPETQEVLYDYYRSGESDEPVIISKEESELLELSAVWNPLHISERLRQHYQIMSPVGS